MLLWDESCGRSIHSRSRLLMNQPECAKITAAINHKDKASQKSLWEPIAASYYSYTISQTRHNKEESHV
jgi:hypothetical protein